MQRGFRRFCIILAIILAIYFTWANAGRKSIADNTRLFLDSTYTLFNDSGKGNIVGISPYMIPEDYSSRDHFFNKLDGYLQIALQKGWLKKNTVVLFPENTAKWLVIEGEKQSVYSAATTGNAMATFVSSNFFSYMRSWFTAPDGTLDKIRYSVFASKGKTVARLYVDIFSSLAKKYEVTIVGSSVLLPNPIVKGNKIEVRKGPLYNTTAIFNPDGSLARHLSFEIHPDAEDVEYTTGGKIENLKTYDLPIGNTIVLLGSDNWFRDIFLTAKKQNATVVLSPMQVSGDHGTQLLWKGPLKGTQVTDSSGIQDISYENAWLRFAMPEMVKSTGIETGLAVHLRGRLWDQGYDGEYSAVSQHTVYAGNYVSEASMVCLWLR
ncbi:hypothetical protein [Pollutibacter soli]|uniref:hypothetical protein n=1 Tax=Pollutibacter soli TaxID=3034157 RepID=UPI0030140A0F